MTIEIDFIQGINVGGEWVDAYECFILDLFILRFIFSKRDADDDF